MTQGISYLLSTNIIPPISARNLITLDILVRLIKHDVGLYFGCALDPASMAAVFGSGAKIAFTLPLYRTKYSIIVNFTPFTTFHPAGSFQCAVLKVALTDPYQLHIFHNSSMFAPYFLHVSRLFPDGWGIFWKVKEL